MQEFSSGAMPVALRQAQESVIAPYGGSTRNARRNPP